MSTLYGFRYKGEDKINYCHCDGYPSELGVKILAFCKKKSLKKLKKRFKEIVMVAQDSHPTTEQILSCMAWLDLNVSNKTADDWYCLLRKTQGELGAYFGEGKCKYMIDMSHLHFSYKYVINLDTERLEIWKNHEELTLNKEVDLRDQSAIKEAIAKMENWEYE
jgi:hypothetical protein